MKEDKLNLGAIILGVVLLSIVFGGIFTYIGTPGDFVNVGPMLSALGISDCGNYNTGSLVHLRALKHGSAYTNSTQKDPSMMLVRSARF